MDQRWIITGRTTANNGGHHQHAFCSSTIGWLAVELRPKHIYNCSRPYLRWPDSAISHPTSNPSLTPNPSLRVYTYHRRGKRAGRNRFCLTFLPGSNPL